MEVWKPVGNYEGIYEVSNKGNVRRLSPKGCNVLKRCKGNGMRRVILYRGRSYHLVAIAYLVLEAFVERQPKGYKPYCIDGDYENITLENLCWALKRQKKYKKAKKRTPHKSPEPPVAIQRYLQYLENKNNK
jgi:hypothetical protein